MAVFKSLTFDGINSLDYGIYITGEAVYNAPGRAVEMVTIPGRNGALAIDQGYFENIEVSYPCGCFAETQAEFAEKVSAFRNAIGSRYSYKRLTDEYNTDEYRLGLYKSGLEVSAVRYGTAGQFTITFDCKPQRFLLDGDAELSPTDYSDVHTVSGDIVQITNDGSLGVKSLTASLEPIQDLHGYDKPWSGGAGKNKCPYFPSGTSRGVTFTLNSDGSITASGTATATINYAITLPISESGSYTLTGCPSGGSTSTYQIWIWNTTDSATTGIEDRGSGLTGTLDASKGYDIRIRIQNGYTINKTFYPMLRLSSETDATYEPYTNICPISGHTECVTSVAGVNVWDEEWVTGVLVADGSVNSGAQHQSRRTTSFIEVKPNTTYHATSNAIFSGRYAWYDADKNVIDFNASGFTLRTINTPTNAYYLRITLASSYGTVYNHDISINYPSTDTDYHAYNGNTYTTDLGRTVYGGTLDVVSGVLTVTDANIASYNGETLPSTWISDRDVYSSGTTPTTGAQVVYKLSSPQTYQLTPQEVELLLGTNNLWTDCGGSTVEYGIPPYYNPTEFDAKPLIKVTGTGTLGIGEYILTITGTASQTLYIDCETMEIYTLEGTVPTGASSLVSINKTDFPVLKPGHNGVSVGTGLSALTIIPKWWRI